MFTVHRTTKGFTLIELLVVIAIIAVLSAIVIASLNSTRTKARNNSRIQTVRELAKALILTADAQNGYPTTGANWVCLSTSCGGAIPTTINTTVDAAIAPYISKPDPFRGHSAAVGFEQYGYAYNSGTASAVISASGITAPAGAAYLYYGLEGNSSSVCPAGSNWDYTSYASQNYVLCLYQLP